ncbi:hypothetical protein [Pseudomonas sp. G(2018)]|uniref:hypothetical protein n=1 Tax=Pseudomonas sp. G(2018) TaxID=2502242 RepID=UPI0010F53757|nr:hypothetical protein [Pseudomonas sp. G(2018)]
MSVETFLWGLLSAAVIALGAAAWQKPDFYKGSISPWMTKVLNIAVALTAAWQISASYTKSLIVKLIPDLSGDLLLKIQSANDVPFTLWAGLIGFIVYEGVLFLLAIGLIQHEAKKNH